MDLSSTEFVEATKKKKKNTTKMDWKLGETETDLIKDVQGTEGL